MHPRTGHLIVASRQRDMYADAARDRRMSPTRPEADEPRGKAVADEPRSRTAPGGMRAVMRHFRAAISSIV